MSKQIESTATQAEQTTALVKYGPAVLNRGEGIVGGIRKAVDLAVYTFASVAFCAIAIASALVGEGDASERTLLLNAYTFAFGFGACCLAKAIRVVRSALGRRSE